MNLKKLQFFSMRRLDSLIKRKLKDLTFITLKNLSTTFNNSTKINSSLLAFSSVTLQSWKLVRKFNILDMMTLALCSSTILKLVWKKSSKQVKHSKWWMIWGWMKSLKRPIKILKLKRLSAHWSWVKIKWLSSKK